MPYFGGIIIKNPGPDTVLELVGLNGFPEPMFDTFDRTEAALKAHASPGDLVRVFTLFDPNEDGVEHPQLEIYDGALAIKAGVIEEEDPDSGLPMNPSLVQPIAGSRGA